MEDSSKTGTRTKTNGYFTLVNLVQGVHIQQSLSRAPGHGRSNQDTEFNIKRCCCEVCWDEACDPDDNQKIMTQ